MTLHANATGGGSKIEIHCTYGPTRFTVAEDLAHAKHFWSSLGRTIEQAEKEQAEAALARHGIAPVEKEHL